MSNSKTTNGSLRRAKLTMLGIFASVLLALPSSAFALQCDSAIVTAVEQKASVCSGQGAYKTNQSGLWICAVNDLQMRILMAALLSGHAVSFLLGDPNPSNGCASNPNFSHYHTSATWLDMF